MLYPDLCRIFRAGFGYTIRFWIHGLFDEFLNIFISLISHFSHFWLFFFRGSGLTIPWGDDLNIRMLACGKWKMEIGKRQVKSGERKAASGKTDPPSAWVKKMGSLPPFFSIMSKRKSAVKTSKIHRKSILTEDLDRIFCTEFKFEVRLA